jgi:hypothetical protein
VSVVITPNSIIWLPIDGPARKSWIVDEISTPATGGVVGCVCVKTVCVCSFLHGYTLRTNRKDLRSSSWIPSSSMRNIASSSSHDVAAAAPQSSSSQHHLTPTSKQQQQHAGGVIGTPQHTETTMSATTTAFASGLNERTTQSLQGVPVVRGQVDDGGAAATQSRSDRQIRSTTHSNDRHQHRSSTSLGILSHDVSSSSATPQGHVRRQQQRSRRRQSAALEPTAVTTLNDSFVSPNQLFPSTRSVVAQRQQPSPFTGNEVPSSRPSMNVSTPAASKALLREAPSSNTSRSKTSSTSKLVQPAHTTSHMGGKSSSADQVRRRGSDSKKQRRAPTTTTSATNNVATFTSPPKRTATNARTSTAVTQNQGGHDRRGHDHHRRPLEPAVASTSPSRLRTVATATTHTTTTTPVAVSRSHEHSLHVQATRRSIDGTYMDAYCTESQCVCDIKSTCEGIGYVQPQ